MQPATIDTHAGPGRLRRLVMTALAVFLITGNVYVAAQPAAVRRAEWNVLPRSRLLWDMFLLPGMFSTYSRRNHRAFIGGKRTHLGDERDRGEWIRLEVSEHLPHRRGVNYTRIHSIHHRDLLGKRGQERAWRFLASRIRSRHNRMHPDQPIERVRIGVLTWPKSPGGFEVRKTAKELEVETFLVEGASP